MRITERRLRSIIRSVIKESMREPHHIGHVGPDPDQALGRPMPKSFEMKVYYAVQEDDHEEINRLRSKARLEGYTDFESVLDSMREDLLSRGY